MKKAIVTGSVIFGILAALLFGALLYYLGATAGVVLSPEKLTMQTQGLHIFDADGQEIAAAARAEDVAFGQFPDYLPAAFVAVEDKRFYEHHGLDYLRVGKAAVKNLLSLSFREGASTISQQLIKNTHLSSEKTLRRKLKEIKLTRALEKNYTKEEILERYLNSIYFGHSAFGIGSACAFYFGKEPSSLTPAESAMLAGLVRSPNRYSPFKNAEKCLGRRNFVLKCMREQGYLSEEEYAEACKEPLPEEPKKTCESGYLSLVYEELSALFPDAKAAELSAMRVYTACDGRVQALLDGWEPESDLVAVVRSCGNDLIRAYRSTCGEISRLPASTVKPLLVYAPAVEENLISPATAVLDERADFGGYAPDDAGGASGKYVSVRDALSHSVNIPAVRILNALGAKKGANYLREMGLPVEREDETLALALGGMKKGFPLTALADGYATLAKGGVYEKSGTIVRVESEGGVLYERTSSPKRVFSEQTSYLVGDMLRTAAKEGTARRLSALPFPVAAKTGTGEAGGKNIDAYTVAYTSEDVAAVWLGNASGAPVEATGGGLPANFVKDIFTVLYEEKAPAPFAEPQGVVRVSLDRRAYEEDHRLVRADPASPAKERMEELFKEDAVPAEQSTRFSVPEIQMPRIFLKNGCVSIVLCQAEYYDYTVKRENRGQITTIYSGKYCDSISDSSVESGQSYTYSVTPSYGGHEGKTVVLPRVLVEGARGERWWDD